MARGSFWKSGRRGQHPYQALSQRSLAEGRRSLRFEPLEDRRMLASTLYVDADASGGNGLSWATAYNDLQAALSQAAAVNADASMTNDVDSIWITEGTYKPALRRDSGDPRSASFSLVDGVSLHGGFTGTEASLAARDLSAGHTTTLTGDIGVAGDESDNAYNVIYCASAVTATLDALSITEGNANRDSFRNGSKITW